MIDLHCHSHYSDGALSPEKLLSQAVSNHVRMLALTDHDTVDGVIPLIEAAQHLPIQIITGIELSVRWKKHDIHILGLNLDPKNESLNALLLTQKQNRMERARKIASLLNQYGINNAFDKALEISGQGEIGRPHFAKVLVQEGVVSDFQAAFSRFLGRGRKAYVATQWLSIQQAVGGILSAGGEAVIAHPLKYKLTRTKLHELIVDFKEAGGKGFEVVSGDTHVLQRNTLSGLCERFNLLASTGSDYHGDNLSRIRLGQQPQLPLNCTPIWHQWTF